MKIGILTFWWSKKNYGQLLQCYALQKYLLKFGHDVFLIKYYPINDYPLNLFSLIKLFKKPMQNIKLISRKFKRKNISTEKYSDSKFPDFLSKYIIQTAKTFFSYKELLKNPPEAEVYIVGSDQVWNFSGAIIRSIKNVLNAYFLNFGSSTIKRLSYAASWGQESISISEQKKIAPLLSKFSYVSVREKSGVSICQKCLVDAEWVPDPVLLLEAQEYRKLFCHERDIQYEKPYILIYLINTKISSLYSNIISWAKNEKLEIVYVTNEKCIHNIKTVNPSIPNWLWLIDNAKYIFTDSYHCCLFSVIFNKKFLVLPLSGNKQGMNSRLNSLWEMLDISPRILSNTNFEIVKLNYPSIKREVILEYIKKFNSCLTIGV